MNSEGWNIDTVLARLCHFMFRYTVKLYVATWPFITLIFLLPKFSVDLTMTVSWFQRWAWILFIGNSWRNHFVSELLRTLDPTETSTTSQNQRCWGPRMWLSSLLPWTWKGQWMYRWTPQLCIKGWSKCRYHGLLYLSLWLDFSRYIC